MRLSESDILGASILIVDDQEPNVILLEQLLANAGYTSVTSTMNPREVCSLHRKNNYDLILLDLQMPGMDGFEVMAGLNSNDTDGYLPVLVSHCTTWPQAAGTAGGRKGLRQQAV